MQMKWSIASAVFVKILISAAGVAAQASPTFPLPLQKAHAHNDYQHPRALIDALDSGFCSIEADPWLVNGTLYVAHEAETIELSRTLESLYIEPLANLVRENDGYVYKASLYAGTCTQIILLIDFKGGAAYNATTGGYSADAAISPVEQYTALDDLLRQYQGETPGLFTEWFANGTKLEGSINAYISGTRPPPEYIRDADARLAALDGRVPMDLSGDFDSTVYPLVSQNWCCGQSGNDVSILPDSSENDPLNLTDTQRDAIAEFTTLAHQQGRLIRYYGTPDSPEAWQMFFDIKTDLINTDDLEGLRSFVFDSLNSPVAVNNLSLAAGSPYTPVVNGTTLAA